MKAVWYERTGAAPDVLTFGDMPTPVAGPGEVRVRLEASVEKGDKLGTAIVDCAR
jgi:NADPH2:quinone reductase